MLVQERVGNGHPDKICDIVAEEVKKWFLDHDKDARTAIEVCAFPKMDSNGKKYSSILIFGEYGLSTVFAQHKLEVYLSKKLRDLFGSDYYDYLNIKYSIDLSKQSPEIRKLSENGAGDQGIIVGQYKEDVENLFKKTEIVKDKLDSSDKIGRDWKLLVDKSTNKVIVNFHLPKYLKQFVSEGEATSIVRKIVESTFSGFNIVTSNYEQGSILSDSGLTGRKIFCDFPFNYRWGGGAVWGKDATKVDNSALLYLREFCKQYALKHKIRDLQITIVYNIGIESPVSIEMLVDGIEQDHVNIEHFFNVSNIVEQIRLFYPNPPKIKI